MPRNRRNPLYHPGNLDGLSSQFPVDNSVVYLTPSMGGMQFGAQYGFGEVPGRSQANRTYSVMGSYSSAKLNLAVAYTDARGRAFDIAGRTGLANALGQDLVPVIPFPLVGFHDLAALRVATERRPVVRRHIHGVEVVAVVKP